MTTLAEAVAQMRAAGMPDFPQGHPIVNAGRITRYGPKKKAWYILREFRAKSGQFVIGGDYGSWGEIPSSKIEIDWKGMAQEEREQLQRERAEAEAKEKAKRAERARFASGRARSQWESARTAKPANIETYLDRKGVEHVKGLRYFADGTVLVPMIRYDITEAQESADGYTGPRRLVGLQKIAPDGSKLFNKGMAKDGAACRLGNAPKAGELILIAEGLATGLSVSMALQHKSPVFVAFDAGNMPLVAAILRKLYPTSPVIICADDDAYLESSMNKLLRENYHLAEPVRVPLTAGKFIGQVRERDAWIDAKLEISVDWAADGEGVRGIVGAVKHGERLITIARENAGRKAANKSAAAIGNAAVVFPVFRDRKLPAESDVDKITDFNDLHKAEGLDAVRAQLAPEIERIEFSAAVRKAVKEEIGKTKKQPKERKPPEANFDWRGFFRRFTLIYPTDTVYDAQLEVIAKLSHIKIAFGEGVVKWWLESPDRRTVNSDDVVFDPTMKCDPETTVNLFRGVAPPPAAEKAGSCARLLELLQFLCGEAGQDQAPVTEWVLNWLALPLQRVGAKMATAVVMHGQAEGTGKNLFFNTLRENVYGRYGGLITQSELESPYNSWMSQRLFMIANEVISRQELRHHVGRIKNLITESPLPISEKYLPMRYESNHMNMVFLTNELQALQISPSDRRFMVIRTPTINQEEFYKAVADEIAAGGAQALHRYLVDRDIGEFNEHTKPLMTAAKEDLIEIGLGSPQQFQIELHDGLLQPLEYIPALSEDLYEVYTGWCARNGVKNPRASNSFSHEFMAMNGVSRKALRVPDPDIPAQFLLPKSDRPQRRVFLMGARSEAVPFDQWVSEGIKKFREAARVYLRDGGLRRQPRSGDQDGRGNEPSF